MNRPTALAQPVALEALACIMAVVKDIVSSNHQSFLPTIRNWTPGLQTSPLIKHRTVQFNAALSNTFGFGGHNASVDRKKNTKP